MLLIPVPVLSQLVLPSCGREREREKEKGKEIGLRER
jgi:hypothetical protein